MLYTPNFRVAHEPIVQTDRVSVRKKGAIGMFFGNGIHVGGVCCIDSITFHAFFWRDSPSIVDAVVIIVNEAKPLHSGDAVLPTSDRPCY
jgi:hypothetical protein